MMIKFIEKKIYSFFLKILLLIGKKKIKTNVNGINLLLDIRDPLEREIFFKKEYEKTQITYLLNYIKNNNVEYFIDVGSNIGYYSLLIAKKFPNIKILSFEPIEQTYIKQKKNITLNSFKNISVFNFGLSDKNSVVKMRSMFKKNIAQSGGFTVHNVSRKLKNNEVLQDCNLKVGDEIINLENKDICIKIDVEEHEKQTLYGIKRMLKNNKVFLQIELFPEHKDENFKFLNSHNFNLVREIPGERKSDYHFLN